jgi:retron-type reverse transcriptase
MDRVCQQAVVLVVEPIFEPTFRDESFGFRPGRSTHMAMRRIWRQLKAGNTWVVDADIADFLEPSSQCPRAAGEWCEKVRRGRWHLDA